MASGTSPSIASNGSGYEVAFQANTGHLYTYNPGNNASVNADLGVASGTSPSIASSSGVYLVAFQANTGDLYTYNPGSNASVNAQPRRRVRDQPVDHPVRGLLPDRVPGQHRAPVHLQPGQQHQH